RRGRSRAQHRGRDGRGRGVAMAPDRRRAADHRGSKCMAGVGTPSGPGRETPGRVRRAGSVRGGGDVTPDQRRALDGLIAVIADTAAMGEWDEVEEMLRLLFSVALHYPNVRDDVMVRGER